VFVNLYIILGTDSASDDTSNTVELSYQFFSGWESIPRFIKRFINTGSEFETFLTSESGMSKKAGSWIRIRDVQFSLFLRV
jgi:hypothetical protein